MRKVALVGVSLSLALFVASYSLDRDSVSDITIESRTPNVLGAPSERRNLANLVSINYEGKVYEAAISYPVKGETIHLYSNLAQDSIAQEAFTKDACELLINAGFYTKENTHLGLFLTNHQIVGTKIESNLANAYFSVNDFGTPRITEELPRDNLKLALQTGPLLIENTKEQPLADTQKLARRSVAAVTGGNEAIFMTIFDPNSKYMGPSLSELPGLVSYISKTRNLNIADAVNLDGGTASAFYADSVALTEVSKIGGYFCVRE